MPRQLFTGSLGSVQQSSLRWNWRTLAREREIGTGIFGLPALSGPFERLGIERMLELGWAYVGLSLWGSETPIICLTCGFATSGEDERALFRMPGKRGIGLRCPLPLGTKP